MRLSSASASRELRDCLLLCFACKTKYVKKTQKLKTIFYCVTTAKRKCSWNLSFSPAVDQNPVSQKILPFFTQLCANFCVKTKAKKYLQTFLRGIMFSNRWEEKSWRIFLGRPQIFWRKCNESLAIFATKRGQIWLQFPPISPWAHDFAFTFLLQFLKFFLCTCCKIAKREPIFSHKRHKNRVQLFLKLNGLSMDFHKK